MSQKCNNCFLSKKTKQMLSFKLFLKRCKFVTFVHRGLGKQLDFHPKLHSRYFDDIFAVFDNAYHYTKFLDLLNSQQNNIKFTVELPSDTIPFFDVEVTLNELALILWYMGNLQTPI